MNKPRFRIVSEDGLNTKVFDLATGDDITDLFAEINIRMECGSIGATCILSESSTAVDCSVDEMVLSVPNMVVTLNVDRPGAHPRAGGRADSAGE